MSGAVLLGIGIAAIAILLFLVIYLKVPAFAALLVVSFGTAIATGVPLEKVVSIVQKGIGGTLGSVAIVVGLGCMLGRMIEVSGGANAVANYFTAKLGPSRVIAALSIAAFILGIPVFFDVGVIILAPIIFGFATVAGLNILRVGLPVAAVLLTVHVAVPPHPGPVAAAELLHVDIGALLIVAIPISMLVALAGFFVAKLLPVEKAQLVASPLGTAPGEGPKGEAPETHPAPHPALVIGLIVLPIVQIMVGSAGVLLLPEESFGHSLVSFIGSAPIALLTAVFVAWVTLGRQQGWSLEDGSKIMDSALPTVAVIIFVTGAGGGLAGVLVESGIGQTLSDYLLGTSLPLILLAYLLTLALRAAQGSATVALLTTAGLLAQPLIDAGLDPLHTTLVALAIGFGGLGLSHINDSGFWITTRYFGLSVKDGLKYWTTLTTAFSLLGFAFTWAAYALL